MAAVEGTWEDLFRPAVQQWYNGLSNSALVMRAYRLSILYEREAKVRENTLKLISGFPDKLIFIERFGPANYTFQEESAYIDYEWINKHSVGERVFVDGYVLILAERYDLGVGESSAKAQIAGLSECGRAVTKLLKFYLGPDILHDLNCEVILDQRENVMTAYFDVSNGKHLKIGSSTQDYFLNRDIPDHHSLPEFVYEAVDLAHKAEAIGETAVSFVLWCAALDCICGSTELQRKLYFAKQGLDDSIIKRDISKISVFRGNFLHNGVLLDVSKPLSRLVQLVRLISVADSSAREVLLQDYRTRFSEPLIAPWEHS